MAEKRPAPAGMKYRTRGAELFERGLRKCHRCKQIKGLDDFEKHKLRPGGRGYCCLACVAEYDKKHYPISEKRARGRDLFSQGNRRCARCKEIKTLDEFPRKYKKLGGRGYYCKNCHNQYAQLVSNPRKRAQAPPKPPRVVVPAKYKARIKALRLRIAAIQAYGGKCACCGERYFEFLVIDHVYGDGAQHRREMGNTKIYKWLKKHRYPKDRFRVLCDNCNASRGRYGYCPHQERPALLRKILAGARAESTTLTRGRCADLAERDSKDPRPPVTI